MRTWSRFLPVATRSPAFHAVLAVPAPRPLPAPVMHQTLSIVSPSTVSFSDQALLHRAGQKAGAIGADCGFISQTETYVSTVLTHGIPFLLRTQLAKFPRSPGRTLSNCIARARVKTCKPLSGLKRGSVDSLTFCSPLWMPATLPMTKETRRVRRYLLTRTVPAQPLKPGILPSWAPSRVSTIRSSAS